MQAHIKKGRQVLSVAQQVINFPLYFSIKLKVNKECRSMKLLQLLAKCLTCKREQSRVTVFSFVGCYFERFLFKIPEKRSLENYHFLKEPKANLKPYYLLKNTCCNLKDLFFSGSWSAELYVCCIIK